MGRKPVLLTALILVAVTAAWGCQPKPDAATSPLKFSLAYHPAAYSGLIAVADERGFFRECGVEVEYHAYPSGLAALDAVRGGEAQAATVADIAFASRMKNGDPSARVVASIGLTSGNQIVARRDRNIEEPSDLRGKVVGYTPDTSSDYFLYAFLLINHISPADVTLVDIPPSRQVDAVVNGEVDAISAYEMFGFKAFERLGKNGVSWDSQNTLNYHWFLAASESSIKSPEALDRFLKALIEAENFVMTHPEESQNIIASKWGFSPELVRQAWSKTRLTVSFNQSIITSLQNYSRWEMERDGRSGDLPDVLNFVDASALDRIDPRLVSIFR